VRAPVRKGVQHSDGHGGKKKKNKRVDSEGKNRGGKGWGPSDSTKDGVLGFTRQKRNGQNESHLKPRRG